MLMTSDAEQYPASRPQIRHETLSFDGLLEPVKAACAHAGAK
jgi:hypothetical protein